MEIVYRSFELDPSTPKDVWEPVAGYLGKNDGGSRQASQQMVEGVAAVASE